MIWQWWHSCATLLWLWATIIGEEQPWPPPEIQPPVVATPPTVGAKAGDGNLNIDKPVIPVKNPVTLDRHLFLKVFRRQAAGPLMDCLRRWQPSPNSSVLEAVFDEQCRLIEVSGENNNPLPVCVTAAISEMKFSCSTLSHDDLVGQRIRWRVDW